jgi:ornithine cyclodeaminase/alanine dehydrogenase-like protein (mu-crystallin family)
MAGGDVLWLSRSDVDAVAVTPNECIDLVRQAMEWQADGALEVPAKIGIHPPKGRHINAMPAFIGPVGAAGLKWVADFPANRKSGLPTIHGLIVLNCGNDRIVIPSVCTAECNGGHDYRNRYGSDFSRNNAPKSFTNA